MITAAIPPTSAATNIQGHMSCISSRYGCMYSDSLWAKKKKKKKVKCFSCCGVEQMSGMVVMEVNLPGSSREEYS